MRYFAALLLTLVMLAASQPCDADWVDHDQYPIDKSTKKCLENARGTGGEVACWEEAYKKWDHELNVQYKALMDLLAPAEKKHLQASELEWMKFRDAELKLIDDVYTHTSGSMYAPSQVASRVRIVRDRAVLLKHYCDLINGN
jgi:uncharacterized protein YecT (DUF1311 family)